MLKIRVAVLRGGPSDSYERSLATGARLLASLPEKYQGIDVFIDRNGVWHEHGVPVEPANILHRVDAVLNALHGSYADGEAQRLIEPFGVAYTGPTALAAKVASNPLLAAAAYRARGIRTPLVRKIALEGDTEALAHDLWKTFPMPSELSVAEISGRPVLIGSFGDLEASLAAAAQDSGEAILREAVSGKRAACAVIENYRGQDYYALLPLEIGEREGEDRYPGSLSGEERKAIERAAIEAHRALGMRHYSKTHFAFHPGRGAIALRTVALPPLHEGSRFERSLAEVGSSMPHFLDHVLSEAMR